MRGPGPTYAMSATLCRASGGARALPRAGCPRWALVVEVLAVRPFVDRGSDAWLMAAVALGMVLDNAVLFTFGKEPRSQVSALAQTPLQIGDVGLGVYPLQLLIPVVGLAGAA